MVGGGGEVCLKGFGIVTEKLLIWELNFFLLPNKTEGALVYSPEALCLHSSTLQFFSGPLIGPEIT